MTIVSIFIEQTIINFKLNKKKNIKNSWLQIIYQYNLKNNNFRPPLILIYCVM